MADNCTYTDLAGRRLARATREREKKTAWHGFHPSVLVCFRRFIPGRAGTAHQKKNARPDGFISHDCSAVPPCCCFFKTSRAMWFGCGAPAEHEKKKLGNSARFLCGCCVACCDLRVRTHLRTHKDRARQEAQSRRQRGHRDCPLDHPATRALKSKPSLSVHSFLLAQSSPTKEKKKCVIVVYNKH